MRSGAARLPLRTAVLVAVTIGVGLLLPTAIAGPAWAHVDHPPLPAGLRADITGIADAQGGEVSLDDVTINVAPDGSRLTLSNRGRTPLVLLGEQAGEPVVRLTAQSAEVNATSPQAKEVEGAVVDAEAEADILDLFQGEAPAQWVPLADGATVTLGDHRGAPEEAAGGGSFSVGFLYGGERYDARGTLTVVDVPGPAPAFVAVTGALAALAVVAVVILVRRRRS